MASFSSSKLYFCPVWHSCLWRCRIWNYLQIHFSTQRNGMFLVWVNDEVMTTSRAQLYRGTSFLFKNSKVRPYSFIYKIHWFSQRQCDFHHITLARLGTVNHIFNEEMQNKVIVKRNKYEREKCWSNDNLICVQAAKHKHAKCHVHLEIVKCRMGNCRKYQTYTIMSKTMNVIAW